MPTDKDILNNLRIISKLIKKAAKPRNNKDGSTTINTLFGELTIPAGITLAKPKSTKKGKRRIK